MDTYVQCLGNMGTPDDYKKLAAYYENANEFAKAGALFEKCHQVCLSLCASHCVSLTVILSL
jgi:methionine synthase I (cobalamin-dependent)